MNFLEKKRQLESVINERIIPLIDNDYVLYGLPYYNNIGDTLIWNGELELLKNVPHRCVGVCGWDRYPGKKLPENVIILITGGGYFGDVWRNGWEFVLEGIRPNKENKIIILPNTVFYEDENIREKDAEYLAEFTNLIICARDRVSYSYAEKHFANKTILVPDMAFCMSERFLDKWIKRKAEKNVLLFKRNDKECPQTDFNIGETEYETHDWLPMEHQLECERKFDTLIRRLRYLNRISGRLYNKAYNLSYRIIYRRLMTRLGVEQLSSYSKIYTTRLHAMILGLMLGREIVMIDNSYGKLSSFYETWLADCDSVRKL